MQYTHTQKAPLWYVILGSAVLVGLLGWQADVAWVATVVLLAAGAMAGLAFCFRSLTVTDEGDRLTIRFGPVPLFRTSIPYADMTSVEAGKSAVTDGWGVHYVPGRGWTYNLWGFGCAVVHRGNTIVRIGSDDVENLVALLNRRIDSAQG